MLEKNPEKQNKKSWRDRILTTVRLLLLASLF